MPTEVEELRRQIDAIQRELAAMTHSRDSYAESVRNLESENMELRAKLAPGPCGKHRIYDWVADKDSLSHLDSFYRSQIDKGMFNEDQVDSLRRDNSHCLACEREAAEREDGQLEGCRENGQHDWVGNFRLEYGTLEGKGTCRHCGADYAEYIRARKAAR